MIQASRVDALIKKDGEFTDWEDREKFYQFREEMFAYRDGNAVNRLLELIFDIK